MGAAAGNAEREEEEEEKASAAAAEEEVEFMHVEAVEGILGYRFCQPALVVEALTHPSYYYPSKAGSYERLEFVGDAVLNCIVAKELFESYEDLGPGLLTRLRAANVDTEKLARVAVNHGLYRYLRHRSGSLQGQIEAFIKAIAEYPVHSNGLIFTPKFLADVVEALLGAVFVDSKYSIHIVWKVSEELLKPVIRPETLRKHPMTELYELCQKKGMRLTFVDTWQENMTVAAIVDGHLVGSAVYGHRKETAQNRAAKAALENLTNGFLLPFHNEERDNHVLSKREEDDT